MKQFRTILFGVAVLLALAACAAIGSQPTSWITHNNHTVIYLSWTNANGNISGTLQQADASNSSSSTDQPVSITSVQLTGTESNGKISLRVGGTILGNSLTGTISNTSLIIEVPNSSSIDAIALYPGNIDDFNHQISTIQSNVEATRTATKLQMDRNQLSSDLGSLADELDLVKTTLSALDSKYAIAKSAYLTQQGLTQQAISNGCYGTAISSRANDAYSATQNSLYDLQSALYDVHNANSALTRTVSEVKTMPEQLITSTIASELETDSSIAAAADGKATNVSNYSDKLTNAADALYQQVLDLNYC